MVERKTGAVDQAQARGGSGDLGNQGGLSEAHFAHTLAKPFISCEFAHPSRRANRQLAKRGEILKRGRGHRKASVELNETGFQAQESDSSYA